MPFPVNPLCAEVLLPLVARSFWIIGRRFDVNLIDVCEGTLSLCSAPCVLATVALACLCLAPQDLFYLPASVMLTLEAGDFVLPVGKRGACTLQRVTSFYLTCRQAWRLHL